MGKHFSLCILLVCASLAVAKDHKVGGKKLPDKITIEGHELSYNGAGLRKKLFIKVYAGALYLKEKGSDSQAIVDADEAMLVRMHFIYDGVDSEKLTGGWNDGFANVLGDKVASMQKEIDQFNSFFDSEAKEDDVYEVIYIPGKGTMVNYNGQTKGTVAGLEFKKAVFGIWLQNKDLSSLGKGMLGK